MAVEQFLVPLTTFAAWVLAGAAIVAALVRLGIGRLQHELALPTAGPGDQAGRVHIDAADPRPTVTTADVLKAQGVLTDAEFEAEKARLLASL